jgi:(1->4)-alpha-D-glucan 1-alpha-D-glucosylmutase
LVDPDNRRPVDYERRRVLLEELPRVSPTQLMTDFSTGAIKLFLIQTVLRYRNECSQVFQVGDYTPLEARGAFADRCFCFQRTCQTETMIVMAPRLTSRIGFPPLGGLWQDTAVSIGGESRALYDLFTRSELKCDTGQIALSQAFRVFPFAVLIDRKGRP